jgi:hypothetical protein
MSGVTEATGATGWWCSRCGRPALLEGDDGAPGALRKAVHAATGAENGPDGHAAAPVGCEPPLWRAARELEAETGGLFAVSARFGFLRADWADPPPGAVAGHYTADDHAAMRARLRRALISAGMGQGTPIMLGEGAGR